jgi:hypothetical protein
MIWRANICRTAPGSDPATEEARVCWELFINFVKAFVDKAAKLHYNGHPDFGWQSNWGVNSTRGIRVWVYGFACVDEYVHWLSSHDVLNEKLTCLLLNSQREPVLDRIGEAISDPVSFATAMEFAKRLTPRGGTCPGAALERSVAMVAKDFLHRPHKVGLL